MQYTGTHGAFYYIILRKSKGKVTESRFFRFWIDYIFDCRISFFSSASAVV